MEALATRAHATVATVLSCALVVLAMTPLGDGAWVAWTLVGVTSAAAALSFISIATRAPSLSILLPVLVPGVLLLTAAIGDHISGPTDERLALAFTVVAGVPLAAVAAIGARARRGRARLQRPGPSFHRRIEALHYYLLMLAIGLGAAVWTHSDEGLGDALRAVIGGGA